MWARYRSCLVVLVVLLLVSGQSTVVAKAKAGGKPDSQDDSNKDYDYSNNNNSNINYDEFDVESYEDLHESAVELTVSNITDNLQFWDVDLAIMFYAPWCQYCKQLTPSFHEIARFLMEDETKVDELVVGRFNCEKSVEAINLCTRLNVVKYPTVKFLGYGNFNQAPLDSSFLSSILFWFVPTERPRLVEFTADMYPEAIYDWIRVLSSVSWFQRKVDQWWSLVFSRPGGAQSRTSAQIAHLKMEVQELRRREEDAAKELDRLRTIELFRKIGNKGDPFPLLHSLEPDAVRLFTGYCNVS
jgi:thiol-disulfide isomerase/thioredoxin